MDSATVGGDVFNAMWKRGLVGKEEGKARQQATDDGFGRVRGQKSERGTSQSCQIQLSWLWFVECITATMTRHPACNSKLHTQMWGTGGSWLISSNRIVARKNRTVWPHYTNAPWRRKNWMRSIWDYTHRGNRWMTLYMVWYHTTVPFQTPSSRNWDTMWTYFW